MLPQVYVVCTIATDRYTDVQAFGTMAILCPLLVPIAYKLTGDEDIIIHTTAAILSSSTLGHCEQFLTIIPFYHLFVVISPISDLTILAKETAGCSLNTHQKSSVVCSMHTCAAELLCLF